MWVAPRALDKGAIHCTVGTFMLSRQRQLKLLLGAYCAVTHSVNSFSGGVASIYLHLDLALHA